MKELLTGLTVCLLASLLLMAVADGVERGYFYQSASLGLAVGELQDRERAFAATCVEEPQGSTSTLARLGRSSRLRNGGGRIRTVRPGASGWIAAAGFSAEVVAILTSASIGFQGSVSSRKQCACLGSFVPRTN
jgi:hypothetical protein